MVIYEGPSQLDGTPVVVIATMKTRNPKTGPMVQTWIMRQDIAPHDAVKSGADSAICGDCQHRPFNGGKCYVNTWQAPLAVWKAYKRGAYYKAGLDEARDAFKGEKVRVGAYGDPAAIPFDVWNTVLADVAHRTGYTHQWRTCDRRFARFVMASADSALDRVLANELGYRVFRVRRKGEMLGNKEGNKEVVCPASKEGGHRTTCSLCLACGGHASKARADIAIYVH